MYFQKKKKKKDTDLFLCWDGIDTQGIKGNNVNSYYKHELIIPREVWYTFTFTWAVIAVLGLLLRKEVKIIFLHWPMTFISMNVKSF